MKTPSPSPEQGSILLVSLFTTLAIGIVLSSFLVLITQKNNLSWRAQDWNAAIPVAEAGVEEALSHLNLDTNTPSANGWTATTMAGQPVNVKQRTFTDGSYFNATIYNAGSTNPIIYSAGFIPSPFNTNTYITRLVRVNLKYLPGLFNDAIQASGSITLNGSNPLVDSYTNPPYSAAKRRANAKVETTSMSVNAVNIGNGKIYGPVTTGPNGTISIGPNGAIGDVNWVSSNTGIQSGYTNNNYNAVFTTNAAPSGPFLTPTGSPLSLNTGTYQLSALKGSGTTPALTVNGNVILYVTGNVNISGGSSIVINSGASLTLVVGGSASLAGGGLINNTADPANFSFVGLPTCTSVSVGGNSSFYGSINAPNASVNVNGTTDSYGAIIGAAVTIGGSGIFHYDESLAQAPYLKVVGWAEL
jgi:hypothetical protein